jgi:hypothetical protein
MSPRVGRRNAEEESLTTARIRRMKTAPKTEQPSLIGRRTRERGFMARMVRDNLVDPSLKAPHVLLLAKEGLGDARWILNTIKPRPWH